MTVQLEIIQRLPQSASHPIPLLFVHGAWHAAWCWDEHFLPYFADHGYCSYALSLRGHGMSQGHQHLTRIRLMEYVHDVEQVASQLQVPPVVIGHSLGSLIAQKFMETHRSSAVILLAAPPHSGTLLPTLDLARRHPLAFLKGNLLFASYPFCGVPPFMPEVYFFSPSLPTQQRQKYISLLQNEPFLAILDALTPNFHHPQPTTIPMLVLGASLDAFAPPHIIKAVAHEYKAQYEIIANASHDMMLETVWQHVAERIITWLQHQGI